MLIRFSLCLLNKKCSNWLLSYNSKTLTFLIVLVLLAGVGKGAEPSTGVGVARLLFYIPKSSLGERGFGGKKKMDLHHKCTILFHSFLREAASEQHCGLCPSLMLPVPSHPSGEMQLQVLNTAKPSRILLNAAKPTEQCSSGAVDLGRALCFRSSVVQLGGFFHSCFLFS